MAPAGIEEQFNFLISCIRHANNGKVDFGAVAKECNVVSKGAAAKRYERLMKAHGIHASQSNETPSPSCRRKREDDKSPVTSSKKSKMKKFCDYNGTAADDEEDEGLGKVKEEGLGKGKERVADPVVKEEADVAVESSTVTQYPWLKSQNSQVDLLHLAASPTSPKSRADKNDKLNDSARSGSSPPVHIRVV